MNMFKKSFACKTIDHILLNKKHDVKSSRRRKNGATKDHLEAHDHQHHNDSSEFLLRASVRNDYQETPA